MTDPIREAAARVAALGESTPRLAPDPVNLPMIRHWVEAIGDARKKAAGLFTGKLPRLLKKKLLPLLRAGSGDE